MVLLKKFADSDGFVELRDRTFVRLLCSADQQPLNPLRLEYLALRIVAEERRNDIDPNLRRLLGKPLETVDVLRRTDRHPQPIRVTAVILNPLVHIEQDPAGIIVHDRTTIQHSVPVHHVDGVAAAVPQHPDTVSGLLGVEHPPAFRYGI